MLKRRTIALFFIDSAFISLSFLLAFYIRFEGNVHSTQFLHYIRLYDQHFIAITIIKLIIFKIFRLYKFVLKYSDVADVLNIAAASVVANIAAISYMLIRGAVLPRSVYIITIFLDIILIGCTRISFRSLKRYGSGIFRHKSEKRIMIIGAGDAGNMIIKEYRNHESLNSQPVAVIDDDEDKHGQMLNGVRVVGGSDKIIEMADKLQIDEIVISIPSATKKQISDITAIAKCTGSNLRIVPGLYELIDGNIDINQIRDVQIQDLLGREEVKIDLNSISSYITGKTVMVTGGGGSIGSELCRQIFKFDPKKLVILDIYENSTYDIQNELLGGNQDINLEVHIGTIRDKKRIDYLMEKERPQVIFHAAAHKHVPLMEGSPKESIKNNVFGTLNLAQAADKFGVKKFVMISTDKAVNPTNIMGASKRICEMIVQSINVNSKTDFVAVRFGNVLGSNGSVIPLFKRQIEEGGPVTVTHPDIIRYFMTIPEAVQLVIEAGSMAKGGEVFVLDMGEPIKILDLAKDLIRLSGFEPNVDIDIAFTGLRPGEKLYEELLLDDEGIVNTKNEKIFIGKPMFTDYNLLLEEFKELKNLIDNGTDEEMKRYVQTIVPNYTIKDEAKVAEELEIMKKQEKLNLIET